MSDPDAIAHAALARPRGFFWRTEDGRYIIVRTDLNPPTDGESWSYQPAPVEGELRIDLYGGIDWRPAEILPEPAAPGETRIVTTVFNPDTQEWEPDVTGTVVAESADTRLRVISLEDFEVSGDS